MIPTITVSEFQEQRLAGKAAKLLDVRELDELDIAQIPHDAHIPLGELPARFGELDGNEAWVVICRSGGRSGKATEFLLGQGFSQVHNLEGGILAWADQIDPSLEKY